MMMCQEAFILHNPGRDSSRIASPGVHTPSGHGRPLTPVEILASVSEEAEILHSSVKTGSLAQVVIAIGATIALLYFLKFVLITCLIALLLAFVLEPLVVQLERIRIPRIAGAMFGVVIASTLVASLGCFLYAQVDSLSNQLSQYSERIGQAVNHLQAPFNRLENNTHTVTSYSQSTKHPVPVQVEEEPILSRLVFSNFGTIGEFLLAVSFIPFLTYFILTWKHHLHTATVKLFPAEHRITASRTVSKISEMIRSFLVANLAVGLIGAVSCIALFWLLGIPFFYLIGAVCGFLSLIPSIGALLALLPPIVSGMGVLHKSGFLIVLLGVSGIHGVTMNFIYPKLVGKRVLLNPLVVIVSLLFWGWIWGGIGLILAIPIVASVKIVCDHTDSLRGFGSWLGI